MKFMITMIITLSLLISFLTLILNKKLSLMEKGTCFECGFNPINPTRAPFSIRFFLLAILFLIFDVEIALILPFPFMNTSTTTLISTTTFLLLLNMGLVYEWLNTFLEWY
uniref:NADH-ubiquinone oxidoreductase chain 3 n=1 Tax=Ricinoides karschii TaxID=1238228 RepID=W5R4G1_9ARAC|nr:NADH dehydrogenase subunit 3 [Ricinoides karschii]AGL11951.1 NADH dehydrogenase subunit 3 [Ricinoides karschii]